MKIFKIKNLLLLTILFSAAFVLTASGGGGGSGKAVSKGSTPTTSCTTRKTSITLFIGNLNVNVPGIGRLASVPSFQPTANNVFTGASSASTIGGNPQSKNYCLITISSSTCKSYSTKKIIWQPNAAGNTMNNIDIPNDGTFSVTVDLYESCGNYYASGQGRSRWTHQSVRSPGPAIGISTWGFVSKSGFCQ